MLSSHSLNYPTIPCRIWLLCSCPVLSLDPSQPLCLIPFVLGPTLGKLLSFVPPSPICFLCLTQSFLPFSQGKCLFILQLLALGRLPGPPASRVPLLFSRGTMYLILHLPLRTMHFLVCTSSTIKAPEGRDFFVLCFIRT